MRITEIESGLPLDELLAAAKADVEPAQKTLADAEKRLGAATAEVQRLRKLFGRFNSESSSLSKKARAAKTRAMSVVCRELDASDAWKELYDVTAERRKVTDSLSYLVSWVTPDAEIAEIAATIDEREACADLLECQATVQKLAMVNSARVAMEYDPGAAISTENSWSAGVMKQVSHIRGVEIPALRADLLTKRKATEDERSTVAVNLFS